MNTNIIAGYLQFLRKSHNYTQEELAQRLNITRQSVSKWETGTTIPDIALLLKLSKLYDLSINDILEPKTLPQGITNFEQISTIPEKDLKAVLKQFDTNCLAIALMGSSPEINNLCARLFPEADFKSTQHHIGSVRIEQVEETQNQIISMINLHTIE